MPDVSYSTPTASGLSKESVNDLAERVSRELGYEVGGSLRPIVTSLGGRTNFQDFWDLKLTAAGSIQVHGPKDFDIYLPYHTGVTRDQFTVAHEIGHYILHFWIPYKKSGLSSPMQATRYGSGRVEWEANWFAAGFLMPTALFRQKMDELSKDFCAVAEEFKVSPEAARIRAVSLGCQM
jgi:predicted transcriptional regulator